MKRIQFILFVLLGLYSTGLLIVEYTTSQNFVRNFFTDISGPTPFFAINTTLCVFLLWATALLFWICTICHDKKAGDNRKLAFYWSQIMIFGYLGLDDRFLIHETIGRLTGIEDAFIILAIGGIELILLLFLGNLIRMNKSSKLYLTGAAVSFFTMVIIDGFFPSKMILRLSMEDLSKAWAALFLFLFACSIMMPTIRSLKIKKNCTQ